MPFGKGAKHKEIFADLSAFPIKFLLISPLRRVQNGELLNIKLELKLVDRKEMFYLYVYWLLAKYSGGEFQRGVFFAFSFEKST